MKTATKIGFEKILDEDLRVNKNTDIKIAVEDLETKLKEFKKKY